MKPVFTGKNQVIASAKCLWETRIDPINRLCRTLVPKPSGTPHPFGSWVAASVTAGDLDAYRDVVLARSRGIRGGIVSVNRCLGLIRAMFNWAVLKGYVDRTPFKVGSVTAVRMLKETPRHRRLELGEEERLAAEASPHLRSLIVAALETCCRQGELLSLQWRQVHWERNELHLPADKTKARRERFIPISQRLSALLKMRHHGPDGREFDPDAYVFGNEIGERVGSVKTAWRATSSSGDRGSQLPRPPSRRRVSAPRGRHARTLRSTVLGPCQSLDHVAVSRHDAARDAPGVQAI